jgi:hypothetical protein
MKIGAVSVTAIAVAFWSSFATAGPAIDAATRAEALVVEGKTAEALGELSAVMDALCAASPLAFGNVVIVDSSAGYGVYTERTDKTFKPDEKLKIYVEPVCLKAGADKKIGFAADLALENATGQVLTEKAGVFTISAPARREFSVTLSFGVPYLRPGEYKATFTVHDQNSDKTGTFEVPFAIGLPTAD